MGSGGSGVFSVNGRRAAAAFWSKLNESSRRQRSLDRPAVMRHKSGERRAESREQRADTRFGRDCAQDGQVRRFPPVRTTCQSIGYERSRVQRQRKHANARFCKSGHVAGTPEVIHPKLVVFISEPISFFSSGRLRALRTTKILVPSGNDLRPDGHIGTPKKRPNVATQLAQMRQRTCLLPADPLNRR